MDLEPESGHEEKERETENQGEEEQLKWSMEEKEVTMRKGGRDSLESAKKEKEWKWCISSDGWMDLELWSQEWVSTMVST